MQCTEKQKHLQNPVPAQSAALVLLALVARARGTAGTDPAESAWPCGGVAQVGPWAQHPHDSWPQMVKGGSNMIKYRS